jgi:hypothetical protein
MAFGIVTWPLLVIADSNVRETPNNVGVGDGLAIAA